MVDDPNDLVEAATSGDAGAIDALIARHVAGLRGFLRRRAGALLARESDDDLLQSVCREVLEDLRMGHLRYRGDLAFKGWLYQAALLKIRDRRRYWGADKRGGGRAEEPLQISSASEDPRQIAFLASVLSPSSDLVRREEVSIAEWAFAQLEPSFQRVIVLARIEGLSHQEVGAELGIGEAHSRVLLSRALAKLARIAHQRRRAEGSTGT